MKTAYSLVLKTNDGRLVRFDSWGVITESGQEVSDAEAMRALGQRLIREAQIIEQPEKAA